MLDRWVDHRRYSFAGTAFSKRKHRQLAITHHAIDDSHPAAGNDPRRNDPNASSVRCNGASADNDHWVRLCRNRGDRFPAAAVGGTNESTAAERRRRDVSRTFVEK